jgi:hypothetical protein
VPRSLGYTLAVETRVACSKMSLDFGVCQAIPALGIRQPHPAILWIQGRVLTALPCSCPATSNNFHPYVPYPTDVP